MVIVACSKLDNDTNIKSTFSTDVYTSASTVQKFMFDFMNAVGTTQYPAGWDNKIKLNQDYIILPMNNSSNGENSTCLVKVPMHGTGLVESCL